MSHEADYSEHKMRAEKRKQTSGTRVVPGLPPHKSNLSRFPVIVEHKNNQKSTETTQLSTIVITIILIYY